MREVRREPDAEAIDRAIRMVRAIDDEYLAAARSKQGGQNGA